MLSSIDGAASLLERMNSLKEGWTAAPSRKQTSICWFSIEFPSPLPHLPNGMGPLIPDKGQRALKNNEWDASYTSHSFFPTAGA